MKKFVFLFSLFVSYFSGFSQFDSLSCVKYDVSLNDVWGYEDELGNEYALVGLYDGISLVDVSNPSAPVELYRSIGLETVWRDLKVFGDYAYVTNENGGGMRIFDLSGLPNNTILPFKDFKGELGLEFQTAHNVFIDENGKAYIVGTDRGGMVIYDLIADPWNPIEIGYYDQNYIHDIYVEDDTAYAALISDGNFDVLDISDPNSIKLISSHPTKGLQAHNTWLSMNGDYLFTTDEVNGGEVGIYDVSDITDPEKVGGYKSRLLGDEMPHNVIVKDSTVFISYYKDGIVALDVSNPENIIEVDKYDTYPQGGGPGSQGAWGVYPYLSSGNILVSDINNGLFVLGYESVNAAYLEGIVTDKITGFPLNGVEVQVTNGKYDKTYFNGEYKVGMLGSGTIEVKFSFSGYQSKIISVSILENMISQLNIELEKLPVGQLSVQISLQDLQNPIGTSLSFFNEGQEDEVISDSSGLINVEVPEGSYKLYVGRWGYENRCLDYVVDSIIDTLELELTTGVFDDFSANQGWQVFSVEEDPIWERTEPKASFGSSEQQDPSSDATLTDCDNWAFCTGINEYFSANSTTVNWTNYLVSPEAVMPSEYVDGTISFSYWIALSNNTNDTIKVGVIQNGDTIYARNFTIENEQRKWKKSSFDLSEVLSSYDPFKFIVRVTDDLDPWNLVDFAVDEFSIDFHNNIQDFNKECFQVTVDGWVSNCGELNVLILNSLGQEVRRNNGVELSFKGLKSGVYIISGEGVLPQKVFWNEK